MKWNYSLTTNTIWISFDYGEVIADTEQEAREKAIKEIKSNLDKVNTTLKNSKETVGFVIDMDFSQVEVEQIK
jgi:hypothetical protein